MISIKDLIRLLRPHQWIKSGFVFTGLLFGHAWDDMDMLTRVVLAAIAFSFVASGVYVFNDLLDVAQDRAHPTKRNRPIASGRVSVTGAGVLTGLMLGLGLAIGTYVHLSVLVLLAIYVVMNIAYSLGLKHVVILDVFIISIGFMLRILVGTIGVGIEPSLWLLFCGMMVTLFLGFSKRRAELYVQGGGVGTRKVLEHYSPLLLDLMIGVTLTCVIMSYSLYTMNERTIQFHGTEYLILTVPFVIYATFRYVYLLHMQGGGEDTARDFVKDAHILVTVVLWGLCVLVLIGGSRIF
ncbi:MAG: decaprenyl-phosphate phosphoribosyltransferase [Spirochaetales bacterium]|nr:decaprenyl-phosphate phosphoribosyltransferase [Leptospiraceae bacterium]MCP5481769.1 decaprenyl-phosphate phosphoribosyltransferase [Spirochaetales bacterium]